MRCSIRASGTEMAIDDPSRPIPEPPTQSAERSGVRTVLAMLWADKFALVAAIFLI